MVCWLNFKYITLNVSGKTKSLSLQSNVLFMTRAVYAIYMLCYFY
jgi:hypothetical protein